MPKGSKRTTERAAIMREADVARAELLKQVFGTLSEYAMGCAQTVGMLGTVTTEGKETKPGHLTAAIKVLEFLAAHAGTERDEALDRLLGSITEIRKAGDDNTGTAEGS